MVEALRAKWLPFLQQQEESTVDGVPSSSSSSSSRHQFVAAPDVLAAHDGKILPTDNNNKDGCCWGVSLRGCTVRTGQGPIANEIWYHEATEALEALAQPSSETQQQNALRKLTLPEMVFSTAHVVIECAAAATDDDNSSCSRRRLRLSWDVLDALHEWAAAHAHLPVVVPEQAAATATSTTTSFRGVSVLKAEDAKLWEQKKRLAATQTPQPPREEDEDEGTSGNAAAAVFHYDWSFSTPYGGRVESADDDDSAAVYGWTPQPTSGLRVDLLTDRSVPILYYDHITLLEDDLHDNGQVQYTAKVRVMPTCAYVLVRLWLCIDHVLVRSREVRVLVEFWKADPLPKLMIHRDVTWRECAWNDLARHGLPTSVRPWHALEKESPAFETMLRQIPQTPLPLNNDDDNALTPFGRLVVMDKKQADESSSTTP